MMSRYDFVDIQPAYSGLPQPASWIFLLMSLETLLNGWRNDPRMVENLTVWRSDPARQAVFDALPDDLPAVLRESLLRQGISRLYRHQAQAWRAARGGENFLLTTGTASGKSLAFHLPALTAALENPQARALYLFPTKALAQDQLSALSGWLFPPEPAARALPRSLMPQLYDGDTPASRRSSIRSAARLLFTNPDMLHTGILPHHTAWSEFFGGLAFVILDEAHVYRGVFGSHVANLLRRLKRVAAFYGARPQFLLASATVGNPREFGEKLIEAPLTLIDQDASGRGERHFLLYNPPLVDESLGLRKGLLSETARLARELEQQRLQTVVFARSRRSVELLLADLNRDQNPGLRGYRSGYLAAQRREIETGLRQGTVQTVIATTALELGIDIGGLGAALLAGWPGSVASFRQQAGRAGRGLEPALAVLVASSAPLDQFLAHHPEYFLQRVAEQALLDPDHLLILLNHLRCALFELPFGANETFGAISASLLADLLAFLIAEGQAHASAGKTFWMSDAYPAASVSLRSASPSRVLIQTDAERPQAIGEVDAESAPWMVHPGAVYLHEGQQYFIHNLNLEKGVALASPANLGYYTEPLRQSRVELLAERESAGAHGWGDLRVTRQVVGFRKIQWESRETLGEEELDLPPQEMETTGFWLGMDPQTVEALSREGLWSNAPNDYGPEWPRLRESVRARDGFRCQSCGAPEKNRQHDVHHKIPFRFFMRGADDVHARRSQANRPENLVTLCPSCHHQAEQNVRIRSGMAGLGYLLAQLAPLFLLCDPADLAVHLEPQAGAGWANPALIFYEPLPAGIGFSERLFSLRGELLARAWQALIECPCADGCPSCVGPGGENGSGGKPETRALLEKMKDERARMKDEG